MQLYNYDIPWSMVVQLNRNMFFRGAFFGLWSLVHHFVVCSCFMPEISQGENIGPVQWLVSWLLPSLWDWCNGSTVHCFINEFIDVFFCCWSINHLSFFIQTIIYTVLGSTAA